MKNQKQLIEILQRSFRRYSKIAYIALLIEFLLGPMTLCLSFTSWAVFTFGNDQIPYMKAFSLSFVFLFAATIYEILFKQIKNKKIAKLIESTPTNLVWAYIKKSPVRYGRYGVTGRNGYSFYHVVFGFKDGSRWEAQLPLPLAQKSLSIVKSWNHVVTGYTIQLEEKFKNNSVTFSPSNLKSVEDIKVRASVRT